MPALARFGKTVGLDLLHYSGLGAAIGRRYAGLGSIFMFHRVVADDSIHPLLNGDLYVTAGFLAAWLDSLKRAGVEVVPIDEALMRIEDRRRRDGEHRGFVVITFDDGYADNVDCALPVLERYDAPFAIYVATALLEDGGDLWWLALERLVERSDTLDMPPMARRFDTSSLRRKAAALDEISRWVWVDIEQRVPLLREVLGCEGIAGNGAGLSEEQLRGLANHPLATIGGHTSGHRCLTSLDDSEAWRELMDNKRALEAICGRPVEHFAYPYGAGGEREAALVGKAGYKTAVTNSPGCLFPQHRHRLLRLPRHPCMGSRMRLSFMHAQRHGVRRFVASRGGCPLAPL